MTDANSADPLRSNQREMLVMLVLAFLLLAPLSVAIRVRDGGGASFAVEPPLVYSGDEPHYFIQISSLHKDGDLDLANNYSAVHRGGDDAGQRFRRKPLNHHVVWYSGGRFFMWTDVYETNAGLWERDSSGVPAPKLRAHLSAEDAEPDGPKYSMHPPGLAFLLAPVLYAFRDHEFKESLAIVCSGMAIVASLVFFRSLVRPCLADPRDFYIVAGVAFLGTPVWHYARTLFTEPYILFCVTGAFALSLRRERHFAAGVLTVLIVLLKLPFAIVMAPLAGDLIWRRKWGALVAFGLPSLFAVAIQFWLNEHAFGAWYRMPQQFKLGNPFVGAGGLLCSLDHGLLPFAPAAIAALAAWPAFLRARKREGIILLSAVMIQFGMMAFFADWHGGYCFGPRYLIPVVPLFFVATPIPGKPFPAENGTSNTGAWVHSVGSRYFIYGLYGASILINFAGAFLGPSTWSVHPAAVVLRTFGKV